MPLITVDALPREELLAISARRWDALRESRPDLAPAVDLQQRLLTIVIDTAHAIASSRLPRLSLPPKYLAAKLGRGVPVLAGEPIPVPLSLLHGSLLALCDALAEGGAADSATHIRDAITDGSMEAGSLLTASLARNQEAIRTGAVHRNLAPDLVWLVAELATTPFAHALQHSVFDHRHDDAFGAACRGWNAGYCPACGSWPALAECADTHRVLRCSFCSIGWELDTVRLHLLRRGGRTVRHGRARPGAKGSPPRGLLGLPGVCEDDRPSGALAVSAGRHRRHGDDGSGSRGHGARVRPAAAAGVREAMRAWENAEFE